MADWTFGTQWLNPNDLRDIATFFSHALWGDFARDRHEATIVLEPSLLSQLRDHIPTGSFGALLVAWCFADGHGNAFVQNMAGRCPPVPESIAQVIADKAADNRWYRRALTNSVVHWLAYARLRQAAPDPWHWPPWAPSGLAVLSPLTPPMLALHDEPRPAAKPAYHQAQFFDEPDQKSVTTDRSSVYYKRKEREAES